MVIRVSDKYEEYKSISAYGSAYKTGLDKLCSLLLAIAPILQHYKGLYENAGFTVLLFAFPILTVRYFQNRLGKRFSVKNLMAILPLLLFEIYTAFDHTVSLPRLLYIGFMMWVFFCVASGCLNIALFLKYATTVLSIASVLLYVQYISHYLFHYTINLRPFSLLVSQDVIWVRSLNRATNAGRLYRPAAFFLEPSHFFLYAFPVLTVLLLSSNITKWRRNKAILISSAMLLTTSGFGIVVTIGLWGLYLAFYRNSGRDRKLISKLLNPKTIAVAILLLLVLVILYFAVPVFQRSINRIVLPTEGSSAIDGRVRLARNYIKTISGKAVLFGDENVTQNLEFNLAGFFATYIKWGLIGVFLTYWFYGQGLLLLKKEYFWISFIIIVISFFTAHTHGTFYMLYYVVFLMEGYKRIGKQEHPRLKETLVGK